MVEPLRGPPAHARVGDPGGDDAFPREGALALMRRLPAYGRLAWNLSRDPRLPRARRGALLGAVAYLISPIDAIPGIIPVLGQVDDVLVVLLALRLALAGLSPEQRREHLKAAGLREADPGDDLETLARMAAWLVRRAEHAGRHPTWTAMELGTVLAEGAAHIRTKGADRVARTLQGWLSRPRRPDG